jgi:hypothetical protein
VLRSCHSISFTVIDSLVENFRKKKGFLSFESIHGVYQITKGVDCRDRDGSGNNQFQKK